MTHHQQNYATHSKGLAAGPPANYHAIAPEGLETATAGLFRIPNVSRQEAEWLDFDEFWDRHGRRRLFTLDQRDLDQWDDMSEVMQ